MKAEDEE